jgi:hypothetical protein
MEEIDNVVAAAKNLIDEKVEDFKLTNDSISICKNVSIIIQQLNDFIDKELELSEERVKYLLDYLVGYFTITLDIPMDKGVKILRARKFDEIEKIPCFKYVSKLSYNPKGSKIKIGRLNKENESIYYGCIYFKDDAGINVAFSEVNALKLERINILKSTTIQDINLRYIGIFDYIRRQAGRPWFISPETYSVFEKVYEYEEKTFDPHIFIAFQLCDAFFSDILRRKESNRLYIVTSILASLFLKGDKVDGILYTSVKAEGSPVLAIKVESMYKIEHESAISFEIQESYGYALYKAKTLYKGQINGEKIAWQKYGCNDKHTQRFL